MPNYNISLNDEIAQIVDTEIKEKKYSSRSEFFRDLIRQRYIVDVDRCDSEAITSTDPDAILIQKRKVNASFIPLNDLLLK